MRQFRVKIDDVKLDTYENVKNIYYKITEIFAKFPLDNPKIKTHFQFKTGNICCSCSSIEEFIEEAYGENNFELISFSIELYEDINLRIMIDYLSTLAVITDDKVILEKFISLYNNYNVNKKMSDGNITNITNSVVVNGSINGDGNILANSSTNTNSKVVKELAKSTKNPKAKIKRFFEPIIQNVLSNFIWYILGIVMLTITVYMGIK